METVIHSILRSTATGLAVVVALGWLAPTMGDVTKTLTYSPSELVVSEYQGYQKLSLPGCTPMGMVGYPAMPVMVKRIPIGPGEWAREVLVAQIEYEELPGTYTIYPVLDRISGGGSRWVEPNPTVYESSAPFPGQWVKLIGQTGGGRSPKALLKVFPVQYVPAEGLLRICTSITFTVYTEQIYMINDLTRN